MDKEIKKKAREDWQNAFPQLSLYTQDKLYKVIGCMVMGLELIKLPRTDEYRPHFVIYPLWKQDVKKCLDIPVMLKEFYNKKGMQYSIPFEKHHVFFYEVLESVKKQTPLPFEGNISWLKLIAVLDEYSATRPLSAAPDSYFQALLQESKLKIALFVGVVEAQSILDRIKERNWDINHFKACGINVNEWLQNLQTTIHERDEFIKQIESNSNDKKLSQFKRSEITI